MDEYWKIPRILASKIWLTYAKIWQGYEIIGLENVPSNGPALIINYHGAFPADIYYFWGKVYEKWGRVLYVTVDKFLYSLPGMKVVEEAIHLFPGSQESCAQILKQGNLLIISPGGSYEALFGDSNYEVLWKNRCGFAKVAIEAKVPIIPMFTENIREAYQNASFLLPFFRKLYQLTKLPLRPVYGNLPVKLRTYLGKPIPYDPNVTPEELQKKVALAIENLIIENQHLPGNQWRAFADLFREKRPVDVAANMKIQKKYLK